MSGDERSLQLLTALSEQEQWDIRQLPADVTGGILRCFDACGWIELQIIHIDKGRERVVCWWWFSPMRRPYVCGTWDSILHDYFGNTRDSTERNWYVRVSDAGKATVTEAKLRETGRPIWRAA